MNADRLTSGRTVLLIKSFLAFAGVLSFAASFNSGWQIWGSDAAQVIAPLPRLLLFLAFFLSLLPWSAQPVAATVHRLTSRLGEQRSRHTLLILMSSAVVVLLLVLSSRNHVLGDGYNLLGNMAGGQWMSTTEVLDYVVHQLLCRALGGDESAALWSYRILSYAAGICFLAGVYFSSEKRAEWPLSIAAATTFPAIFFFFGYVESYTFAFVFMTLYLLSALKDAREKRLSLITVIALLLAVGFHLSSATLIPSLLYVLYNRRPSRNVLLFGFLALVLAVGVGFLHFSQTGLLNKIFVPIFPTGENPYSLLSWEHLADLARILLFNFPLLVPILLSGSVARLNHRWFHVICLLSILLFTVLVDPKIGALRDWDLLNVGAAVAIVVTLNVLRQISNKDWPSAQELLLPLILFGLLHTGCWVWLNSKTEDSYKYVKEIVKSDIHYSGSYYEGYRNKSWAVLVSNRFQDHEESLRSLEVRLQARPDDVIVRHGVMMEYYVHRKDPFKAASVISGQWMPLVGKEDEILDVALVLARAGKYDETEEVYEAYVSFGGTQPHAFYNLGLLKEDRGDFTGAWNAYKKALELDPAASIDDRVSFYLFSLRHGHSAEGESGIMSILSQYSPEKSDMIRRLLASTKHNHAYVDTLEDLLGSN